MDTEGRESIIKQLKLIGDRVKKIADSPGTGEEVLNLVRAQQVLIHLLQER